MDPKQENIKTNFLIVPRSINNDKIGIDVRNQYIRLGIIFVLIFIAIILSLKEYLDGIRFIRDFSITDTLLRDNID